MDAQRNSRRLLRGTVSSDKMDKTITVVVERLLQHPKYLKYLRRNKKYHAHDENNDAQVGDVVEIVECRPISKNKRWRLNSVIERAVLTDGGVL
jgi:small subunit ribosomal protein S17